MKILSQELADLEDRSLRFERFQEEANETWEGSKSRITDFVNEKLGIEEDILIERVH